MPLATLTLLSLLPPHDPASLLQSLRRSSSATTPLVAALPIRWIITPSSPTLLAHPWSLLLVTSSPLPEDTTARTCLATYSLQIGIPSAVLASFQARNQTLLSQGLTRDETATLTGALDKPLVQPGAQNLEFTTELFDFGRAWAGLTGNGQGQAVSMLNLLSFRPGKEGVYRQYGAAFAQGAGRRRGGDAKIVGRVVRAAAAAGQENDVDAWDEVALAHYPSMAHFLDMLASADYQEINHKWRLPSLRETCILMTSEVLLDAKGGGAPPTVKL